jgi:1-deoxy-D-xylulose-5-phosphate reductoisomerase
VHAFLAGRLPFLGIPAVIERTLDRVGSTPVHGFEALYGADAEARLVAGELVGEAAAA